MLTATLDETYQCAIAHLGPGESLVVTAPPAEVEITGKPDQPWVWLRYDDFGVRTSFGKNLFATVGLLNRRVGTYGHAMAAGEAIDGFGVARIRGHLEGTKRKPVWMPDGFEVVMSDTDAAPSFWPPRAGDVWLSGLGQPAPQTWVCREPRWLNGAGDWAADEAYEAFGPLRLVWRDGAVVTAMHASELAER